MNNIIQELVNNGFPNNAELVDDITDVPPEERFWIVPGKSGPRWLIPQDARYNTLIFQHWRPYDLVSKAKWQVLYSAAFLGQLNLLPGLTSVGIAGSARQTWEHLGWNEDCNPVPITYIGTPGPTQKAVISLFDAQSKKLISVAKIPLGSRALSNILHEYDVLCNLDAEKQAIAPRPLFVDKERGLAVQEAIVGKRLEKKITNKHLDYLNMLKIPEEVTTIYYEAEKLVTRFKKLNNTNNNLIQYIDKLSHNLKDVTEIPVSRAHGDFKPWNIMQNNKGKMIAIDWEFAESKQVLGLDIIHYFFEKKIHKKSKVYRELEYFLQQSGVLNIQYQLIESLLTYHSLWYAVMLCENGYNVSDHVKFKL